MTEDKDWFVIVTEVQNMRWLTSVATSILWTTAPESRAAPLQLSGLNHGQIWSRNYHGTRHHLRYYRYHTGCPKIGWAELRGELSSDTFPASPISEYNPSKQYWQASSIILYEWCYSKDHFNKEKAVVDQRGFLIVKGLHIFLDTL